MLKVILSVLAGIVGVILHALSIKPKPESKKMAEKSATDFSNLDNDSKIRILQQLKPR